MTSISFSSATINRLDDHRPPTLIPDSAALTSHAHALGPRTAAAVENASRLWSQAVTDAEEASHRQLSQLSLLLNECRDIDADCARALAGQDPTGQNATEQHPAGQNATEPHPAGQRAAGVAR